MSSGLANLLDREESRRVDAMVHHHARPEVTELPLNAASAEAERLGVNQARLNRLIKLMTLATNPGTPAEGAAATRALHREIATLNISKVDADALLRPASEAELLDESGNFLVAVKLKRKQSWLGYLSKAVADLLGCKSYWSWKDALVQVGMYGAHGAAATAAHLFADVYVQLWRLSDSYKPGEGKNARTARADYRMAMTRKYSRLCAKVAQLRKDAVVRHQRAVAAKAEAEEEAREKKRLRVQAAREELRLEEDSPVGEDDDTAWVPPTMQPPLSGEPLMSVPPEEVPAQCTGADDSDEDDVQVVEVVSPLEREKRKAEAAFQEGGGGIIISDDEDETATLALAVQRNDRINAAVEKELKLSKGRRARRIVIRDADAWRAGKKDAERLPTSRALGGV